MEVFIIAAQTADGFIGRDKDHISTQWTSKEDSKFFMQKTKEAGVVVMGRTTYETVGKPLPNRLNVVYTSNPEAIETADNLITTDQPPQQLINSLTNKQYDQVAICGGSSIYRMFMEAGVVDSLFLTVEPILFGTGIPLFDKSMESQLNLKQIHQLSDQTVVMEYGIKG